MVSNNVVFTKISLKFSGNALRDWMVNIFTKLVTTVLHDLVMKIVQNVIILNIDEIIDFVNNILRYYCNLSN